MAVEWKRVAMQNDLKERTLCFEREANSIKGITETGITFMRSSVVYTSAGGIDQVGFPEIGWSSTPNTGADLGSIEDWQSGTDLTGVDSSCANFWLKPDLSSQSSTFQDHMLESLWASVMIVPGGDPDVNKHTISISGLVRHEGGATATVGSRLHFQVWRAYAGYLNTMSSVSSNGLNFKRVSSDLTVGGGGIIEPSSTAGSITTFTADTLELNLDPSECGGGKSCYYLVGVWASSDSPYTPSTAHPWPSSVSQQVSMRLQTSVTFTPE